jgi:hypothetical protein
MKRNGARFGRTPVWVDYLEPSVAQPPLPLQEFLPLQPLSLELQPPLPLQEFKPLQACFSTLSAAGWPAMGLMAEAGA